MNYEFVLGRRKGALLRIFQVVGALFVIMGQALCYATPQAPTVTFFHPTDPVPDASNPVIAFNIAWVGHSDRTSCKAPPGQTTNEGKNTKIDWFYATSDINADTHDGWTEIPGTNVTCQWDVINESAKPYYQMIDFSKYSDIRELWIKADVCVRDFNNVKWICRASPKADVINHLYKPPVANPPTITGQPVNCVINMQSQQCHFDSAATGEQPLRIQWQRSYKKGAWEDMAGANSASLSGVYWDGGEKNNLPKPGSGKFARDSSYDYRVKYSNAQGSVISNKVTCRLVIEAK